MVFIPDHPFPMIYCRVVGWSVRVEHKVKVVLLNGVGPLFIAADFLKQNLEVWEYECIFLRVVISD